MTVRLAAVRMGLIATAFCALYLLAIRTSTGQRADVTMLAQVDEINQGWGGLAGAVRENLLVAPVLLLLVLGALAFFRGQFRAVAAALLLVVGSFALGQALKYVWISRPDLGDFGYRYNSFPSGHTIAFASVFLGIFVLAPARFRTPRLACLLAILTAFCALSSVVAFAHRPSDVVAGILVVAFVSVPCGMLAGRSAPVNLIEYWAKYAGAVAICSVVLFVAGGEGSLRWAEPWAGNLACLGLILSTSFGLYIAQSRQVPEPSRIPVGG